MDVGSRIAVAVILLAMVGGCTHQDPPEDGSELMSADTIEEVLAAHTEALMAVKGVVGSSIGLCDGAPCIQVFVTGAAAGSAIPDSLGGYAVRIEVTGPIRPRGP